MNTDYTATATNTPTTIIDTDPDHPVRLNIPADRHDSHLCADCDHAAIDHWCPADNDSLSQCLVEGCMCDTFINRVAAAGLAMQAGWDVEGAAAALLTAGADPAEWLVGA